MADNKRLQEEVDAAQKRATAALASLQAKERESQAQQRRTDELMASNAALRSVRAAIGSRMSADSVHAEGERAGSGRASAGTKL